MARQLRIGNRGPSSDLRIKKLIFVNWMTYPQKFVWHPGTAYHIIVNGIDEVKIFIEIVYLFGGEFFEDSRLYLQFRAECCYGVID